MKQNTVPERSVHLQLQVLQEFIVRSWKVILEHNSSQRHDLMSDVALMVGSQGGL